MTFKKLRDAHSNTLSKALIIITASIIVLGLVIGVAYHFLNQPGNTELSQAEYSNYPQLKSSIDADDDGIDDQNDVLQNAREWLSSDREYKNEYFSCGYPDNGTGVCADVVAWSMLHAGYDLRALINEDIAKDKAAYNIVVPDENADFRRVETQHIWFKRNTIELATDTNDGQAWQGGDIVVFKDSIGIISDKRNENGVPYVLHFIESSKNWEEDILEGNKGVICHYRISE
ncbi:MAG: DUF1287 domain-containing protein [Eggerthellaceae bacterium]|nr:DUF1287 domain-containing protein [Eggerthellaceae bacterium]